MKKLTKIKGHQSKKYGEVLTNEQKKINELVSIVNILVEKVKDLELRPFNGNGIEE